MRKQLAVLTCVAALAALPAGAAVPSSVDQLSATSGSGGLTVTGSATFRDVPVDAGTDASGDATMQGTDLTRASISLATASKLKFRLDIADPLPELSSSPVAVTLWPITVDGVNDALTLHASRARAGSPPNTPHLRVVRIVAGTITTVATVTGTMANGVVEWEVSLSTIGASPGSVITSDEAITVIPGISGVGTLNGNNFDDMFTENPYTVPSRTVLVGVGPAGDPADSIPLNTAATVAANGSFSATLPPQPAGSYQVVARACYGPQSCGTTSTPISI